MLKAQTQDGIRMLSLDELEQVSGGRSETKDGKGCTEHQGTTKGGSAGSTKLSLSSAG
jgi:hypothetical protein